MKTVSTMGSGNLGCEIELEPVIEALAKKSSNEIDVNFHSPSIATIKFRKEGPAITLYRTGTFQIRGTEDPDKLKQTKKKFVNKLEEIGVPVDSPTFEHQNTVFMEDIDKEINLETLSLRLGLTNIEYEPEQFPGLIYRPENLDAVMLIFASGKMIISGTTTPEIAEKAVRALRDNMNDSG